MEQFYYDSDMVGGSLMVRESRIIARLLLDGVTPDQWDQAIRVDNLLQKRSPASAKRNAQAIRQRLERLTPKFWRALKDGDDQLATQVSLCGALARNPLLMTFMESVLLDAYRSRVDRLDAYLWTEFLQDCSHRDPTIAHWTESTKKKTGQVAYRMLTEAGYLSSTRQRLLQPVAIRPEVREMLNEAGQLRVEACMEVSVWTRSVS